MKIQGDLELHSSYYPLCMLDTAIRVLERLIRNAGYLSPSQCIYSQQSELQSTILEVSEAVSVTIISLAGLWYSTWGMLQLCEMVGYTGDAYAIVSNKCRYLQWRLDDYLKDHILLYFTRESERKMDSRVRARSGSVLRRDLWNVSYGSLLRMEMPEKTHLIRYSDDVEARTTCSWLNSVK